MAKKVALSGYYGFDNFGDETILQVLCQNLCGKYDVTVFSKNPQKTAKRYGIKSVQSFSALDVLWTLSKTDILISGGGSLLQDSTSTKSLVYYLSVLFLAQIFKKKTIIFAQGIGPIKNKFLQKITQNILQKCDFITVRDEKSLFLLRGWGLAPVLVADPVWGVEVSAQNNGSSIGVQLRQWANLSDEFLIKLAAKIVEHFPTKKILLFSFQNSIDLPVCEKFKTFLIECNPLADVRIVQNDSLSQLVNEIQSCEILFAMRFHAILLALKSKVTTVALNYDIKVQTLAQEVNIPVVDLNDNKKLESVFEELENIGQVKIEKNFNFNIFYENM